jgi:hypothetical protein
MVMMMNPTQAEAEGDGEKLARDALRTAIEHRDLAAGELAQAEKAHQMAFDRSVEIGATIAEHEARRRSPDRARVDSAVGDTLVEALLAERDLPAA